ncbi:MAG: glycosyl hydrolase [Thermoleophilia bacterium]
MTRTRMVALLAAIAALAFAGQAAAASKMFVGGQDDRSFQLLANRGELLDRAVNEAGWKILRTNVAWYTVAPTRPANGADSNDPAYNFAALDELVNNARARGLDVLITIFGTPGWAAVNGPPCNGLPNPTGCLMPKKLSDLTNFARAVSSRYGSKVRFYTVWNEANTGRFLFPQYKNGKPVSPANYVKLYKAAYKGIKAGNPKAKVAIGLTSPRGRKGIQNKGTDQLFPLDFMKGVAKACGRSCKFDAYAHNPYPTNAKAPATQGLPFPSVNLSKLGPFVNEIKKAFKLRKAPKLWITEMGFRTNPPDPKAMSASQQAQSAKKSLQIAKANKNVELYIWFILQDDSGAPAPTAWEAGGGLLDSTGAPKPALAAFAAIARGIQKPY